jgi:hypothetical protein
MIAMAMQPLRVAWVVVTAVGDLVAKEIFQVHFLMCLMIYSVVAVAASVQVVVLICVTTCALTWKRPF